MTQSLTSPLAEGPAVAAGGGAAQTLTRPPSDLQVASVGVAAVTSGIATRYWIELVAYPPGSARSLWLYVNNIWNRLDNPSASIQDVVQRALLGTGSNVRVWYDNGKIVGLVVEGS